MTMQNPDRVVTKSDLKDFYDEIYPYLGGKGGSSSSGGASSLSDLTDTTITTPTNGQVLVYDETNSKWINGNGGSGSGTSNYTDLENKPKIDNIELSKNTTSRDLHLYSTQNPEVSSLADSDYFPFYDTSTADTRKTLWSTIKSTLGNIFQPKLTAGNNVSIDSNNRIDCAVEVIGTFSKSDLHSTTEKVIGCWTDGRPLYQKSYTGRLSTSNTDTVIDSSFSFDLVESDGAIYNGSNDNLPVNFGAGNDYFSACYRFEGTTHLVISVAPVYKGYYYRVTVRYTKDSDAANSYNYSDENDYSTNEHVIGTWVDGSLLYQRTFTGTTSNSTDDIIVSSALSSSWRARNYKGCIQANSTMDIPISFADPQNNAWFCHPYKLESELHLYYGSDFKGKSYWLTVQYTK